MSQEDFILGGIVLDAHPFSQKYKGGRMIHGEYRDLKELEAMMHVYSESTGGCYSLALAMLAVAQALQDQCAANMLLGNHIEELASEIHLRFPKVAP